MIHNFLAKKFVFVKLLTYYYSVLWYLAKGIWNPRIGNL